MTDEEIYSGTSRGDETALRELFVSTREHVERVCAFFLGEDDRLPMAVVGTYDRALEILAPEAPAPEIPLRSWLSILATQECFQVMEEIRRDYDRQTKALEDISGNISTLVEISSDPKERWAQRHPEFFPVRLLRAGREELLRVPGLGPVAAERILGARRLGGLRSLEDAGVRGRRLEKASGYVVRE